LNTARRPHKKAHGHPPRVRIAVGFEFLQRNAC
jgi:hypothetical protein